MIFDWMVIPDIFISDGTERNRMNTLRFFILMTTLILTLVLTCPVQAFVIDSLTIDIRPSGDAVISISYTLNTIEQFGVYLGIADPGLELKKALESNFKHTVTIEEITDYSTRFLVSTYLKPIEKNGSVLMKTPALSFAQAEQIVNQYWFASIIDPDFSPQNTTIIYPDGYCESYTDQSTIPATSHILNSAGMDGFSP